MSTRSGLAVRILRAFIIVVGVGAVVAGGTWATAWWINKPRVLRMAVGPEGSLQARFATKLAAAVEANSRSLRIVVVSVDAPANALARLAKLDAEIAIGRTDLKFPSVARNVAILEHDVAFLVTARNAKMGSLPALRGKKIAVVGADAQNEALLQRMMDAVQVPANAYTVQTIVSAAGIERLIGPQAQQAVVQIGPLSQIVGLEQLERLDRRTSPVEVHGIAEGKAIERRVLGLYSETIEAGAITATPKWPPEDVETVAAYHLLVVANRLPPSVVTELTRIVFENKEDLALEREFATRIEAPELGKDELVIAHQGAADYVNGEVKSFAERYSDYFYIGSSVLGIVLSILYGLYRWAWNATPLKPADIAGDMIAIADKALNLPTLEGLDAAEVELEGILKEALIAIQEERLSTEGIEVMRLAYEHAHRALAARRKALLHQGGGARVSSEDGSIPRSMTEASGLFHG